MRILFIIHIRLYPLSTNCIRPSWGQQPPLVIVILSQRITTSVTKKLLIVKREFIDEISKREDVTLHSDIIIT